MAYHIAKVSNTYVVSTLSYYILTSSFDYEHVIKFHGSIESSSIEITSYGYTDMGSIAHSLSYTAVANALDRKLYKLVNMEYPWKSKRRIYVHHGFQLQRILQWSSRHKAMQYNATLGHPICIHSVGKVY